jgi:hypothetical protein
MATKKQKRAAGIAKREAEEQERRQRGLEFLRLDQERRTADRKKAEDARIERAKAKSKKLAQKHRNQKKHEKQGVQEHKPAPVNKLPRVQLVPDYDSGL